jgi:hypothetical protein
MYPINYQQLPLAKTSSVTKGNLAAAGPISAAVNRSYACMATCRDTAAGPLKSETSNDDIQAYAKKQHGE